MQGQVPPLIESEAVQDTMPTLILETQRLRVRTWEEEDLDNFTALHTDPTVMEDQGGPLDLGDSRQKLQRYAEAFQLYGYGRMLVETIDGNFLGYCGVMPVRRAHPLGPHDEIGWRLLPEAWGHGYATEAAHASLSDGFNRVGLTEVLAYTAADNLRSQAVMNRLELRRDASLDFTIHDDRIGGWRGLVWKASHPPSAGQKAADSTPGAKGSSS